MDLSVSPRARAVLEQVERFIHERILPIEASLIQRQRALPDPWVVLPEIDALCAEARQHPAIYLIARQIAFVSVLITRTRQTGWMATMVDKLLALTPKLRAAQTDAERQTLQNAVTATDQQIEALVYELYGLTAEEIKLVEGVA